MPKKGDDRTKGIDIQALEVSNINTQEKPFRINVWDFGGQEIYHATHQFFLTKRSLYVIVNNTRSNLTDFNQWLQTISLFSDNSPVIIVQNQVAGSPVDLDLRGLQAHFSNILFVKDADLSNTDDGRLQKLIQSIELGIQQLPHVGSELPKLWVAVRNALQEKAKEEPFISARDFYAICRENKIEDKDAVKRLGGFLHDLGVFLHFQDDPVLRYTVILQNSWATKGVYTILDDERTRKRNGHFSGEEAEEIWAGTEFEDMHHELLQLMKKFELCYEIPDIQPTQFVSPQLLPIEKPKYDWDNTQNLTLYYDYGFMPKGLMGRLIVRLHRYIKDINSLAWRSGCIFTYENTDAQVIETYGNKKIEIRVRGKNCVRLSSIIICEIDALNKGFEQIKVAKMVPCNCMECSKSQKPHFHNYENLMYRKSKGKLTVECSISFEDVSVKQILDGVFDENQARKKGIPELIGANRISEALSLFSDTHPEEAALISSRYNEAARMYYLGQLPYQNWIQIRDEIAQGILALSKMEPSSGEITGSAFQSINKKLDEIKSQLNQQDIALNRTYEQTGANQRELLDLLEQLQENPLPDDYIDKVVDVIERGMTDFQTKFPQAGEILDAWKTASQQLKLTSDSKAKLKFTIPFVFCSIEKEYAWNGWDWFRSIKEDIRKGKQGKWHEMFVEGKKEG
ncbi:MAG: hypothetical protein H6562_13805 [Lewinellaceae bacterium]|nr:hypothetical protein [Lewinellaceae bacterium]